MINLLPPENKKQLRASLHNTLLRGYIGLLLVFVLIYAGVFGFVYITIRQSQDIYRQDEAANNQRVIAYADTKKSATELSNNLKQAKVVLDQRVDYSQVLFEIAKILPEGVSINSVRLESKLFEGEKPLEINLVNSNQSAEIKKVLENSGLFKSVVIVNVVSNDKVIKATFNVVFDRKGFGL